MNRLDDSNSYPIREFARLTGVNPVTLRAWERRYGIIRPQRTAKGHRFYTDEHIRHVKHILYWLDQGYPIRQVRLLLKNGSGQSAPQEQEWQSQQQQMLQAARQLNSRTLDELLNAGFASYPLAFYYQHCLQPVITHLRSEQPASVAAKIFIRLLQRKLNSLLLQHQRHNTGPVVLFFGNDEQAETELLICACALAAADYRCEYYGTGLTPEDIRDTASITGAAYLWGHFYPLTKSHQQSWLSFCHNPPLPLAISGTPPSGHGPVPDHHAAITHLQGNCARQIRDFIAAAGSSAAGETQ